MSKEFSLTGGDADFANRQKSVFDQLGSISVPSSTTPSVTIDDFKSRRDSSSRRSSSSSSRDQDSPRKRSRETRETKQFRGQESLFKRPEPPPPWRRGGGRMPDHKRNPQGWTRYSLGDVSSDDMSDRTNTSTALSFLNELKKRKDRDEYDDEDKMDVDEKRQSLQFKRPARKQNEVEVFCPSAERSDSQGPQFRGSKRVMPEYVVGQKSGKSVKRGDVKVKKDAQNTREMKLSHLVDSEELEEDE
jgi:Tumour suppressing sub-chromosomal transferable candidate 4